MFNFSITYILFYFSDFVVTVNNKVIILCYDSFEMFEPKFIVVI